MVQTYNLNSMIPTAIAASFEKRLEKELVIGKAARVEFKNGINKGDEVKVIMPARVNVKKWDGGDLEAPDKIDKSEVKVKIDQGLYVNFELEKAKEIQIQNAQTSDEAAKLIDEYSADARYQVRDAVDTALGQLYTMAGSKIDKNGGAYALTQDNFYKFLADMKAKMSRNNVFQSGKMSCYLPPEAVAVALGMTLSQYTESQVKDIKTGFVSEKAGWKIYESNNVAVVDNANTKLYYPLFTVDGRTFAAPLQKSLDLIPYMRDESVNKAFKGTFVFGRGVPNSKYLGTCCWSIAEGSYE